MPKRDSGAADRAELALLALGRERRVVCVSPLRSYTTRSGVPAFIEMIIRTSSKSSTGSPLMRDDAIARLQSGLRAPACPASTSPMTGLRHELLACRPSPAPAMNAMAMTMFMNGPAKRIRKRCHFGLERNSSGFAGDVLLGGVAGHAHVAAEGDQRDAVVGVALAEAEQALAEAEREDQHADAEELGDEEVTGLVDEDQERRGR